MNTPYQVVADLVPLLDRLAALIPPPRRHRYHGVPAPHSPLRAAVKAYGRDATTGRPRRPPRPHRARAPGRPGQTTVSGLDG